MKVIFFMMPPLILGTRVIVEVESNSLSLRLSIRGAPVSRFLSKKMASQMHENLNIHVRRAKLWQFMAIWPSDHMRQIWASGVSLERVSKM